MQNTSVARKVDKLGCVVIPVELHRNLEFAE